MKPVVIDYETFYDKNAGPSSASQGVPNYVSDPQSYAYILSVVTPDYEWVGTIEEALAASNGSKGGAPNIAQMTEDRSLAPWAANSNFDQAWTERYFGRFANPWQCILDVGAGSQLPHSLAGMFNAQYGIKVDKTLRDQMSGRHWKDLGGDEKKAMLDYCLDDSRREFKLIQEVPPLSPMEQRIAAHTRLLNRRGCHIDVDLLEKNKSDLEEFRHRQFCAIPWHNDAKPLSPNALKKFCGQHNIPAPKSTAKTSEECEDLMSEHPVLNEVLTSMRMFRKANTLIEKIAACADRVTEDGRIPLELIYCGARHTRRWSSRGFNVQNLDKEPFILKGEELLLPLRKNDKETPAQTVLRLYNKNLEIPEGVTYLYPRHWLTPPPGKTFLILDFAQIEPRCLNWLVGNDEMLALVRQGFSVYEAAARAAGAWSGNEELKHGNPDLYKKWKALVLGMGYGMGWKKHAAMNGLTEEVAKAQVEEYRSLNPRVPAFWNTFDQLVKQAVLDQQKVLNIQMPTGEWLSHFYVRAFTRKQPDGTYRRGYESYTTLSDFSHLSHQDNLWGGTLTENVTQRMARDVMAWSMPNLEKAGLPVCFTSHDEVILVVDDDNSKEEAKREAVRILSTTPDWAEGLPLAVEGDFSSRYTKQ